jgi:hypothetical protein
VCCASKTGLDICTWGIPAEARISVVTESSILPESDVREKFKRVKPLSEISVTQRGESFRGWTFSMPCGA